MIFFQSFGRGDRAFAYYRIIHLQRVKQAWNRFPTSLILICSSVSTTLPKLVYAHRHEKNWAPHLLMMKLRATNKKSALDRKLFQFVHHNSEETEPRRYNHVIAMETLFRSCWNRQPSSRDLSRTQLTLTFERFGWRREKRAALTKADDNDDKGHIHCTVDIWAKVAQNLPRF